MIIRALIIIFIGALVSCSTLKKTGSDMKFSSKWDSFENSAINNNSIVSLPPFERSPQASLDAVDQAIHVANSKLDAIGRLKEDEVTFDNTIVALDDMAFDVSLVANRTYMLKETSESAKHRKKATDAIKKIDEWAVGLDYREDVYRAVKAFVDTQPELQGEDKRLLDQTLRDYRRAGLHLSEHDRNEVEKLRKELSSATTEFRTNITNAKKSLKFTKSELVGLPDAFLDQVKTAKDQYTLQANVTFHYLNILRSAKSEQTRIRFSAERLKLASDKNVPLLKKIIQLRALIANKLGYKTWADYRCEVKMAGDGKTASDFLMNLKRGLEPKWKAEMAEFTKIKRRETNDSDAVVNMWDIFYYENLYKKERFSVDAEQLRVFFPYEQTLQGMFRVYEEIFRLKIVEAKPQYKWNNQVTLHLVYDSLSGEPLGALYLDMFPRDGKFVLTAAALGSTVKMWDTGSGRCEKILPAHPSCEQEEEADVVQCTTLFSPEGGLVLTTCTVRSLEATVKIWNACFGTCMRVFNLMGFTAVCVVFLSMAALSLSFLKWPASLLVRWMKASLQCGISPWLVSSPAPMMSAKPQFGRLGQEIRL